MHLKECVQIKEVKDIENNNRIKASVSIEHIRFYKNNWGIAEASIEKVKQGKPILNKNGNIIIKGGMPQLIEGSIYTVVADYVVDDKWGEQYDIISIYTDLTFDASDNNSKKKFLASIFTPLQVKNMYDALEDPFATFTANDASQLVKVKGCGMDTAARWINKFNEHIHLSKIYTELDDYNLTNNMIKKLINKYKSPDLVVSKVKTNPYVLCTEVDGIGWKTADKIAIDGGMSLYSPDRIGAYIIHYLKTESQNGFDYVTSDELLGAILQELGDDVPDESITEAIHNCEEELWWNEDKSLIGLKYYRGLSEKIAQNLLRLLKANTEIKYDDNWKDTIKHLEHAQGWSFTEEQMQGIQTVLENNVCVITGGAGTGKSTLVSGMLEVLRQYSYVQCALSGRASSRMAEITNKEGYTIHRLLGFPCQEEGNKNGFAYHDENPLMCDIIIVDEISMIDSQLFYFLVRAIQSGSKLVMLGDTGQLESIGCGNVAYDMIKSPEIPTVMLTKIHRQAADSAIITEADKVRHGIQIVDKDWVGTETRGNLQDLTIDCFSDKSNTFYKIVQSFSSYMSKENFNIMSTQIIVPVKSRGDSCTYNINNTIQELYNPANENKNEITLYMSNSQPFILREGDKVINVKNNYKTNPSIYNGNIGIINEINIDDDYVVVDFLGIGQVYIENFSSNGSLELGYAVTVHKMQGSEFDNVIFGLDFSAYSLLTKELVYTGITRAKKKCELICQTGALRMAVSKEGIMSKQTHLQDAIYNEAHPKFVF